jgi:uncharacterized protein (TIGR02598 family)
MNQHPKFLTSPSYSTRVFLRASSLIEVTIALGLFTFAVSVIVALLPAGLSTIQSAMNQTVEAQIVRKIAGQSIVANFADLADGNPVYFDDEGLPAKINDNPVYTVTVSRHSPIYPGSDTATSELDYSLSILRIEILEKRGGAAVGSSRIYSLYVANYGK